MKKSTLLLFTTIAIPALVISQTIENPTPTPAPIEAKPVLPGDPVPVPVVPDVPAPVVPPVLVPEVAPVPVPPVPVPAVDVAKPVVVVPDPLTKPDPHDRGKGKGKGRPDHADKDKEKGQNDPKKPAPAAPVPPLPVPETQPAPDAPPPVPAERMKRPSSRPAEDADKAMPPVAPVIPTPAPDSQKSADVPRTRPVPPAPMPAQPSDSRGPDGTPPPVTTAEPKDGEPHVRQERPVSQVPPSKETAQVLEDQGKRDRKADAQQAEKIEGKDDAKRLILNILGGAVGAAVGDRFNQSQSQSQSQPRPGDRSQPGDRFGHGDRFGQGYRPPVEEVGRTQQDRERNVGSMVQRFQGRTPQTAPPGNFQRDPRGYETSQTQRHTQFYEGNRRVVRYSSMQEIPPVIVASQRLNRVQVMPLSQSAYNVQPQGLPNGQYYNEAPPSYTANNAYAVSYAVDPGSAISRDDILFRQGSTDFADAYSYDLVIDVAEALNAPSLRNETFVIEGHASAEGDYGQNLLLSQERAERISRELVRHGVSPERLMPVGYGETEAAHPANAAESQRSLDRRVMVFRMR